MGIPRFCLRVLLPFFLKDGGWHPFVGKEKSTSVFARALFDHFVFDVLHELIIPAT